MLRQSSYLPSQHGMTQIVGYCLSLCWAKMIRSQWSIVSVTHDVFPMALAVCFTPSVPNCLLISAVSLPLSVTHTLAHKLDWPVDFVLGMNSLKSSKLNVQNKSVRFNLLTWNMMFTWHQLGWLNNDRSFKNVYKCRQEMGKYLLWLKRYSEVNLGP